MSDQENILILTDPPKEGTNAYKLVFGYSNAVNKTVLLVKDLTQEDVNAISEQISSAKTAFINLQLNTKCSDNLTINRQFLAFFFATPCDYEAEIAKSEEKAQYRNKKRSNYRKNDEAL